MFRIIANVIEPYLFVRLLLLWYSIGLSYMSNAEEYNDIEKFSNTTTSQSISEYARSVLLKKPVIVKYRNESIDEILSEMIRLKNELNAIGNNYNQAVHKLHTLDKIPEIKTWVILNEKLKKCFLENVDQINYRKNETYTLWSQK
ncbi:MAG: plasmid mobilization protein [Flavisolibacter sp.]